MLIATFGPTTDWVGKSIDYDGNVFAVAGAGQLTADEVMLFDADGQLAWVSEEIRDFIAASARATQPVGAPPPKESTKDPKRMLVATFGPTTAWVGKTITFADGQFILEGHGTITAQAVLEYGQQGHLTWAYDDLQGWVEATQAASAVKAGKMTAAGSRPTPARTVDLERASRGDWVVGGGFLALLLGTSLTWYSFSGLSVGFTAMSDDGWNFAAGWLSWLAGLVALAMVIVSSGVIPRLHIGFRGRAPLIVTGLGVLALVIVFVGLVTKPAYDESFGVGIFVSLIGAAAVAAGGWLKLGEPVPLVSPSAASDAVDKAMDSARGAFTTGRAAVATRNVPSLHL